MMIDIEIKLEAGNVIIIKNRKEADFYKVFRKFYLFIFIIFSLDLLNITFNPATIPVSAMAPKIAINSYHYWLTYWKSQ